MRRWHQDKKARVRIEIIPMIDVMMFLLVFFVLISIDVIHAFGVKTRLYPQEVHGKLLKQAANVKVMFIKSTYLKSQHLVNQHVICISVRIIMSSKTSAFI